MYKAFFGLRDRPFDLTSDPRFLFLSKGHREALSLVHYGISGDKGITLLTGEAGTGKTTVLRAACQQQSDPAVQTLQLFNPLVSPRELQEFIVHELRLHPSVVETKIGFLRTLHQTLHERRARGRFTALIIDEAQGVTDELFEELRMLGNLESSAGRLLSIVLTGQPELAQRLNQPHLRAFKQRIALRTSLLPFTVRETAGYVATRVQCSGGTPAQLFTAAAVEAVHRAARGIARSISVICDNALIATYAMQQPTVTEMIVREVCSDLDFEPDTALPIGHVLAPESLPSLDVPPRVEGVPASFAAPTRSMVPLEVSIALPPVPNDGAVATGRARLTAVPK
jgi:type II secretory pathway predicted ATPase ExeA